MTSAVRRDSATSPSHDIWRISLTGRRRPWKSSSRFTALPLVILVVVVCLLLFDPGNRSNANGLSILSRRNYIPLEASSGDLSVFAKKKCENIYAHEDQCAFVMKRCEDSEVGMIHYLKFYFCTMEKVRPIAFIIMILWLGLLFSAIGIAASDFFCPNLATLSRTLRMSESMAGVTFLALGNGSPDLFSTFAAMRVGSGGLAIGELIGAAFFITSVVAGSMAIVNPFRVSRKSFLRDCLFFAGAVAFSVWLLFDGKITMWETSCMILYYIIYVIVVVMATWYWGKRSKKRRTESRARQHYQRPEEETAEVEDDETTVVNEETRLMGDVRDLEDNNGDDEEEQMEGEYAGIQHRMSLVRPTLDVTRLPSAHHHTNIRPSLFGALEFRSLSNKLASASALNNDRRHSLHTPTSPSASHSLRRNLTDPTHAQSAPPQEVPPPWQTPDPTTTSRNPVDYFTYPAARPGSIRRAPSPLRQSVIAESPEEEEFDPKASQFLRPPIPRHGSLKQIPTLRLDTTDDTLVSAETAVSSREVSPVPGHLGFRDIQDSESLTSSLHHTFKRFRWWPYFLLPAPQILYLTLFPTLLDFRSKTFFQKVVAILAIPAVFCFTITLPVVDVDTSEAEGEIKLPNSPTSTILLGEPVRDRGEDPMTPFPNSEEGISPMVWNRWLTGVQCIFAPLFLTLIIFQDDELLVPLLYALVVGLITLALLLTFSSPDKPPSWHKALCAVGFVVAIAWISTIADEVVGVLRAFGAILGVSEAILGVTIFAMGNSLSDFVADVTVAKMGFPMMAFSACFGGPMLNILLGVGVSGLIIIITSGEEYYVHISSTLLVSTVSLLLTLSCMLVVVPWSKWRMTRTFGICLVGFFTLSTIASVLVEIFLKK